MKITKPEKFPIEFSDEELETLGETIFTLGKIMSTLEKNGLTVLQNSGEGNCLDVKDINRIHDALTDLIEMDEAF